MNDTRWQSLGNQVRQAVLTTIMTKDIQHIINENHWKDRQRQDNQSKYQSTLYQQQSTTP